MPGCVLWGEGREGKSKRKLFLLQIKKEQLDILPSRRSLYSIEQLSTISSMLPLDRH